MTTRDDTDADADAHAHKCFRFALFFLSSFFFPRRELYARMYVKKSPSYPIAFILSIPISSDTANLCSYRLVTKWRSIHLQIGDLEPQGEGSAAVPTRCPYANCVSSTTFPPKNAGHCAKFVPPVIGRTERARSCSCSSSSRSSSRRNNNINNSNSSSSSYSYCKNK